jgi:hypothetical protein
MTTRYVISAVLMLALFWAPLQAEKVLSGSNGLTVVGGDSPAAEADNALPDASAKMESGLTAKSAVLSGGAVSSSTGFRARDAFGSVVAGVTRSQGFIAHHGFLEGVSPAPFCLAGDADGSGKLDIDDSVYLLAYIFITGPSPVGEPCCGDANGDGVIDIDDVVYMLAHCFAGGPDPIGSC